MPAYAGCFRPPYMLILSIYVGRWQCRSCKPLARPRDARRLPPHRSRPVRRGAPLWRAADAFARMERAGRARDRAALRAHREGGAVGRVAVLRALCEGDQCAQEGAQRRHPGAQLPDAGNLQLRRRFRRRLAAARARGGQGRRRHHRAVRRALHGRDVEDPQSRQDRADPRSEGRLLARLLDHRRGRAAACARNSRACRWSPMSTRRPT